MTKASRVARQILTFLLVVVILAGCGLISLPGEGPDSEEPTVTLTSSAEGDRVRTAGDITLTAAAEDNQGVAKVEFFKDEAASPFDTDDTQPFTTSNDPTVDGNGTVRYKAVAFDAAGNSASDTLDIAVSIDMPGNQAPTATDLPNERTPVDTAIDITLAAEDPDRGDTLTFEVLADTLDPAEAGTLSELDPATNTVTFMPASGFEDTATFEFTVTDAEGESDTGKVTIAVGGSGGTDAEVVYVDGDDTTADTEANAGSQDNPFNTLQAAQDAAAPGAIIFVYATTDPYTSGIELESGQQLIGEAAGLTVGEVELVPAGERPVIEPSTNENASGRGVAMFGSEADPIKNVTIRGLEIRNSCDSGIEGDYLAGLITIENVIITSPGTVDEASTPCPNGAGHSGIYLNHSPLTDQEDTFIIRDVRVTDPARFGIWLDDPNELVIEDNPDLPDITGIEISGVKTLDDTAQSPTYGAIGLDVQTEYGGAFTITDVTVNSSATGVGGIRIIKNGYTDTCGGGSGPCNLEVELSNNSMTLQNGSTQGVIIQHFEDGVDGDDHEASGTVTLSGSSNSVQAEQIFVMDGTEDGPDADSEADFGALEGTVEINGQPYPTPGMAPTMLRPDTHRID